MNSITRTFKFLSEIFKPFRFLYGLMFLAPLINALYQFANNYIVKLLIDIFSKPELLVISNLFFPIGLFLASQILMDLCWRIRNWAQMKSEPYIIQNLILKAYLVIQDFPMIFFKKTPTGVIISKIQNSIDMVKIINDDFITGILNSLMILLVSIIALGFISQPIFFFILIWAIFFIIISIPMIKKINQLSQNSSKIEHQILGDIQDKISNIYLIKNSISMDFEYNKLKEKIHKEVTPKKIKVYKFTIFFNSLSSLLYFIMLLGNLIFLVHLRQENMISSSSFIFVILTSLNIATEMWRLIHELSKIFAKIGTLYSSLEFINTPQANPSKPSKQIRLSSISAIEFKDISFGYEKNNMIIKDFKLKINAGEKIAIIGLSGAGKTTLINLLLKHLSPLSGKILINHRDINKISTNFIRSNISLISQDVHLFNRSILENIRYLKKNASLEDVIEAARKVQIHEVIEKLPHQYFTKMGERGMNLSGGEKQRIAIARTILGEKPIIIFDESTSNLDSLHEHQLQESLKYLFQNSHSTIITIAHRLSTIHQMERIIVIDNGKIIEEGHFLELIQRPDGFLKKLWNQQTNLS